VKSTISGVVTIYDEVVNSSLTLMKETGHATANVVEHKYGKDAGAVAKSSAEVIDNMSNTLVNINKLGVKPLAKRIVANTTVDILSDEEEKKQRQQNQISIDPLTGMQVLMLANNMNNVQNQYFQQQQVERHEYLGLNNLNNNSNNNNNVLLPSNINNNNNNASNINNSQEKSSIFDPVDVD